jgi:ribosomal protein S18 acetylase RimI-like enzyme
MKEVQTGNANDKLSLRKASVLDVPFIFKLMMEGSESGVFSMHFQVGAGGARLLWLVLSGVLNQKWSLTGKPGKFKWQVIVDSHQEEIGFLKVSDNDLSSGIQDLELLAVSPGYRNRGIGTAVLHRLVANQPDGLLLRVHCTKYARAMQHILKKNSFKRTTKTISPGLERYHSVNRNL